MKNALDRAKKLEAEAKAIRRQEQAFWEEVVERWDEILTNDKTSHLIDEYAQNLNEMSDRLSRAMSDNTAEEVGKIVIDVCGDISNFVAFRSYIERYRTAIQKTQSTTEEETSSDGSDEVQGVAVRQGCNPYENPSESPVF